MQLHCSFGTTTLINGKSSHSSFLAFSTCPFSVCPVFTDPFSVCPVVTDPFSVCPFSTCPSPLCPISVSPFTAFFLFVITSRHVPRISSRKRTQRIILQKSREFLRSRQTKDNI